MGKIAASFRKRMSAIGAGLALTLFSLLVQITPSEGIGNIRERLDWLIYDLRLNWHHKRPTDSQIVIVDIDERSLQAEGHWPWDRSKLAGLVDRLFDSGAVLVAFDMVFAESQKNSVADVMGRLAEKPDTTALRQILDLYREEFDQDAHFASSLEGRDVVLGYIFHNADVVPSGLLPTPLNILGDQSSRPPDVGELNSFTANIAQLQKSAITAGFFTAGGDADGVIRRAPLLLKFGGHYYASLALEVARLYQLHEGVELVTHTIDGQRELEGVRLGNRLIPTDASANVIVPYRGGVGSYQYFSAVDVMTGSLGPGAVENRIVIVGTTATGLVDLRATPVGEAFPGVEIQANLIDGLLSGSPPVEPGWGRGANVALLLACGLLLSFLLPFLNVIAMVLVVVFTIAAMIVFNFMMWSVHGLVLSLSVSLLMVSLLGSLNLAFGFFHETRSRGFLKSMFGLYVPPELVNEMLEHPDNVSHQGEVREMTVLFADIRNFTTISESLSATDLRNLLNRFFTPMTQIIFQHRGTIDKYVGDMIMAFWGAPLEDDNHAIHALEAGASMLEKLEQLNGELIALGLPQLRIGIGINTGPMVVGDMGSEFRRAYTVLGDAVNLGSRLEGLTKYYGVSMVVGETTRQLAEKQYLFRSLDLVRVKGKQQAEHVYEPVCRKDAAESSIQMEIGQFEQVLAHYFQGEWDQAESELDRLVDRWGDSQLYTIYMQRIRNLRQRSPENWDGIFERRTK